jgi:integrase
MLKKTKTILFVERILEIMLPNMDKHIDPNTALKLMMELRRKEGFPTSAESPLFTFTKDQGMTASQFSKGLSKQLKAAQIPTSTYTPHSLRRGGSTFALEMGCNPTCIQLQGDWASDAWMIYAWVTDKLKSQTVRRMERYTRN